MYHSVCYFFLLFLRPFLPVNVNNNEPGEKACVLKRAAPLHVVVFWYWQFALGSRSG